MVDDPDAVQGRAMKLGKPYETYPNPTQTGFMHPIWKWAFTARRASGRLPSEDSQGEAAPGRKVSLLFPGQRCA